MSVSVGNYIWNLKDKSIGLTLLRWLLTKNKKKVRV